MNSALLLDRRLSLTYTHSTTLSPVGPAAPPSRTAVDCSLAFDPANKLSLSHSLGSGGCRVKYSYAHGEQRLTTIEPCFDTAKNAWDFAVTRKFTGGDAVKGTYHASTKLLALEWTRDSKIGGSFKVATSFDLSDQSKAPKLIAESTWNYEI
uniref:Outer envelope pore protein 24, chloroplastic n=1 Tax=Leersia perrieri TaxID=77586 RepID=A0A0D9W1K5_9ORYZ